MLKGFLLGVGAHLSAHGQAWLVMSDFAEHLGLRGANEIANLIEQAGLRVLKNTTFVHSMVRCLTQPTHCIWRAAKKSPRCGV